MYLQIMPQAVCTRYGLKVGAIMAPLVRVLLVLFFPIAYPISKVEILIQFVSFTGRLNLFFLLQSVSWFWFRFLIGCWVRDMVFFYGELSSRHSWHSMETRLQLKPDSCVCFLQQPFWFFYFIFGRLGKVEIWQPMRLLSSQVHLNWQKRQQKMQWLPFPTRSPLISIQLLICGFLCFMFRALFIFLYSVMLIICFHLQYRETLNTIMSVGHSRVPVYFRNPSHIIGLILVPIFNSFRCCISFLSFGYLTIP